VSTKVTNQGKAMTYKASNSAFQRAMELIHEIGFDVMGETFSNPY
jgi:hypothetical protein